MREAVHLVVRGDDDDVATACPSARRRSCRDNGDGQCYAACRPAWATIVRRIFSQFAEHLGYGIYGGLWVGQGSKIPNIRSYRTDVVAALKALAVPLVRWPDGYFADDFDAPDVDKPTAFSGATLSGETLNVILPPRSVVMLDLQ